MTNKIKYKNITYFMKKHYPFLMKILFIFSMNCVPGPQEADVKTFFLSLLPYLQDISGHLGFKIMEKSTDKKKKKYSTFFSKNNHGNINTKF